MDEMKEIREFLADKPEPGSVRLAPARSSLMNAALREGEPTRKRRYGRRIALAGGLAAALTTGAILAQTLAAPDDPVLAPAPASAAELLHRAAKAAEAEPWIEPRDDQYIKVETVGRDKEDDSSEYRRSTYTSWKSVDSSRPSFRQYDDGKGRPFEDRYKPCDGDATYADLRKWPTDDEALLKKRLARVGKSDETADVGNDRIESGMLMVLAEVPPTLRSAIFKVAADLPGAKVKRGVADVLGRRGIAVSLPHGTQSRTDLIFDQKTYRYLGYQYVWLETVDNYRRAGDVDSEALKKVSVVDELPARAKDKKITPCV